MSEMNRLTDALRGELALDAAVAPGRVLLRQPEDERGAAPRYAWSTGPGVRVGPGGKVQFRPTDDILGTGRFWYRVTTR